MLASRFRLSPSGLALCCSLSVGSGCLIPPAEQKPTTHGKRTERDLSRFELAWREDFDQGLGKASLGDWTFETNEVEFHADNATLVDGRLALHLSPKKPGQGKTDRKYIGAEYDRTGPQTFGRFLARMRPSAPPGVIASFFTGLFDFDAQGNMRETAEIDIEFVGTTRAVQFAIHWIDDAGKKEQRFESVGLDFDAGDDFHVWEIEWLPDHVAFYVDGRELHRFSDPEQMKQLALPQEVKANLWITSEAGWAGPFAADSLPVTTEYDWIEAHTLRP
jgi:beta-glucanase (GH16 family)